MRPNRIGQTILAVVDRPWWFKVLTAVSGLSVIVVVAISFTPIHAGGSNEDGFPSFKCGTIAGLLSHPSRSHRWEGIDQGRQFLPPSDRPAPLASGCKIAMFPSAMAMVLFSLVGIAAAVAMAIAATRKRVAPATGRAAKSSSPTGFSERLYRRRP